MATVTPGAGLFDDASAIRRVHRERLVALHGPRTLLVQGAHPVAFTGFWGSTRFKADPWGRLQRTGETMHTIVFGPESEARAKTDVVRRMHARAHGELPVAAGRFPAGTPYAADDPELLLWILAAMVDSIMVAHDRYVRPLTPDEREGLWQDYRVVGELFGLPREETPADVAAFDRYMATMYVSDDLAVTADANETGRRVVMAPPVPLYAKGLMELVNQLTISILPARVRRMYGFWWDPGRAIWARGTAEYVRRVARPLLGERVMIWPDAR